MSRLAAVATIHCCFEILSYAQLNVKISARFGLNHLTNLNFHFLETIKFDFDTLFLIM